MTVITAYIPDPGQTEQQAATRAAALGIGITSRAIPPVYQSAVTANGGTPGVVAEYGGQVAFLHDDGTKTPTDVANLIAPLNTAQAAAAAAIGNVSTIQARALADLTTIEAWVNANPSGATLTGPQTLVLAKMLTGLCRLVLGMTSTQGVI